MQTHSRPDVLADPRYSFHEATLTRFEFDGQDLLVICEGVTCDHNEIRVTLRFVNAYLSIEGGAALPASLMEAADGELLTLRREGASVALLIEWNEFEPRQNWTRAYQIIADTVVTTS